MGEGSANLGFVSYIDWNGMESEYFLDAIFEEALATRNSYCSSLISAAMVLQTVQTTGKNTAVPLPKMPPVVHENAIPNFPTQQPHEQQYPAVAMPPTQHYGMPPTQMYSPLQEQQTSTTMPPNGTGPPVHRNHAMLQFTNAAPPLKLNGTMPPNMSNDRPVPALVQPPSQFIPPTQRETKLTPQSLHQPQPPAIQQPRRMELHKEPEVPKTIEPPTTTKEFTSTTTTTKDDSKKSKTVVTENDLPPTTNDVFSSLIGFLFSTFFYILWLALFRIPYQLTKWTVILSIFLSTIAIAWLFLADDGGAAEMGAYIGTEERLFGMEF